MHYCQRKAMGLASLVEAFVKAVQVSWAGESRKRNCHLWQLQKILDGSLTCVTATTYPSATRPPKIIKWSRIFFASTTPPSGSC